MYENFNLYTMYEAINLVRKRTIVLDFNVLKWNSFLSEIIIKWNGYRDRKLDRHETKEIDQSIHFTLNQQPCVPIASYPIYAINFACIWTESNLRCFWFQTSRNYDSNDISGIEIVAWLVSYMWKLNANSSLVIRATRVIWISRDIGATLL